MDDSASKTVFKSPEEIPHDLKDNFFDAIVVLGGGVPITANEPPIYVQSRCKYAATVYESSSNKPKILALSAGTAHVPQLLSSDGLPVWESTATASFLIGLNIPRENVYVETTSYDTISNAFFTRTNFCSIAGWKRLLIITNEFHMMRTKLIFDWVMNAPDLRRAETPSKSEKYELYYLSVPDSGLSVDAVQAREEREEKSADNVKNNLSKKYSSLEDVFNFITQDHSFYTSFKLIERANEVAHLEDTANMDALRRSYGGKEGGGKLVTYAHDTSGMPSFMFGALFGIAIIASLQLLMKRGAKSHNK